MSHYCKYFSWFVTFLFIYLLHIYLSVYFYLPFGVLICVNANIIFLYGSQVIVYFSYNKNPEQSDIQNTEYLKSWQEKALR